MAIVQNPIIGRSKGKFANAIFQTWKGINTLRSLPESVANPQTEAQMNQRNKNTSLVWASIWYRAAYLKGFAKLAIEKSEFNVFMQKNFHTVTNDGGFDIWAINPAALTLAQGTLGTYGISTAESDGIIVNITWNPATLYPNDSPTDKVFIVLSKQLDQSLPIEKINYIGSVQSLDTNVLRSGGNVGFSPTISLSAGDVAYASLFFYNEVTKEVSNSSNLQITIT